MQILTVMKKNITARCIIKNGTEVEIQIEVRGNRTDIVRREENLQMTGTEAGTNGATKIGDTAEEKDRTWMKDGAEVNGTGTKNQVCLSNYF